METKIEYAAVISHNGDEKYIVAKITNKLSKQERLMIISHPVKYHSHIVSTVEAELGTNERIECLGGGLLKIDREQKKISTYGQSGGYGPPELAQVRLILENSKGFTDFELDIQISSLIRD